jgi:hypothetical protein
MMKQLAAALLAVTAGCATAEETDGAFHINGRVDAAAHVTHVVAANPATAERIVVELQPDGSFDLAVSPGSQWVVTFTDWTKVGMDMQVATLQADGLDAFVPQGAGSLDFGTIKLSAGRAHGTTDWNEVIAALGITDAMATRMGRTDNLALRYANPDIDNDGTLDALQFGHSFKLDIAGSYSLTSNGRPATIADLVAGTYANAGLSYYGTAIQAVVPRDMNMNMTSGTLTFEEAFYGAASPVMVAPGTVIGAPHVKFGSLEGAAMIGVVSRPGANAPSGAYEFGFANGQLTFSDVHAPSAALLETGKDYAVPFVHIRATDSSCSANCDIGSLDIAWRTLTADGWQATAAPSTARIDVVASMQGNRTSLAANLTDSATTIAWRDMPVANAGILSSELAYVTTSGICYLSVSYLSELGMKMTMSVANPACY